MEFVLSRMHRLSPIMGPVARYLMSAIPHFQGDKKRLGEKILQALELPVIKKSPYLQIVLLDVLAVLPELNHADAITARYGEADPAVRREILSVAAAGGRGGWLRDRKNEFRSMDPWSRRAFVRASVALPEEEAKFWIQSVRDGMTPMEKVVARHAFKDKQMKLGNINVAQ
jgi:hypothetical protein